MLDMRARVCKLRVQSVVWEKKKDQIETEGRSEQKKR